ncbi:MULTISPECIES: hypothetical protein [unclassified Vibrio]|uniref:hypothetical protein n=1 Tax=unclassified Vibrio TaxID=2614977 RepID=UPI002964B94D|nr:MULTISPECIES: hypothetical protein [unclassified Vibrio]MDW1675055.1 hypothetical protein [Vibrio sp. Vb2610]MDW1807216.1 hypothetical protein [Vibrio sp. Vb2628]
MSSNFIEPDCERFIHEGKQIEEAYAEACEWISSFGVPYQKTRFGAYEKDLEEFLKGGGPKDAKESVTVFMNAHKEAAELVRIMNVYKSFDADEILEPIKKMTSGQRFRNATTKDQSRDFAFELGVASRFIKAGYTVDLRGISDLVVDIDGTRLYVECKRMKSFKQLGKRVQEANKQIRTRLSTDRSSKSRGMIALNVTDIVMENDTPIIFPKIEDYQQASAYTLKSFVMSNKETLGNKRVNKCLGVLTEFTTQGIIFEPDENEMAFANIREGNVFQYPMSKTELEFLNSFWKKLGNQNI